MRSQESHSMCYLHVTSVVIIAKLQGVVDVHPSATMPAERES
jgi:hypothetical protein